MPAYVVAGPKAIAMCDEYDDERTRAFWRAVIAARGGEILDEAREDERPLVHPALTESAEPAKARPRALTR